MKLRNLFLASLAVCTMASCSKDDDGISGPQEVGRRLSLFRLHNRCHDEGIDRR